MFTARTSPGMIDRMRLEAEYYDPAKLSALMWMEKWKSSLVCLDDLCEYITDGTHVTPTYFDQGVPFLSSTNIDPCSITFRETKFITPEAHIALGKAKCNPKPGDILLAKNGKIGTAAVFRDHHPACSVFVSVALLRNVKRLNRDYVAAFLNSSAGWHQFARSSKTGVITNLHLEEIREVSVPDAATEVQTYIGSKVRLAERLQEYARAMEVEIDGCFHLEGFQGSDQIDRKAYRVPLSRLSTTRLDAPFHGPVYFELTDRLRQSGARPLLSFAEQIKERWEKREREFLYLDIGHIDLASGTVEPVRLSAADAPSRAQRLVRPWDVLVSTVRANRKNVAIVPEVDSKLPLVASTGFSVLRFSSPYSAVFYHAWLRSDLATSQLMQWTGGGAYPDIDDDVAAQTLVPNVDPEIVLTRGERWMGRLKATNLSNLLMAGVVMLVESVIDGRLAETEVIECQRALERGDDALDRKVLARLTTKGIDAAGASQLFPSLDDLFAAESRVRGLPPLEVI